MFRSRLARGLAATALLSALSSVAGAADDMAAVKIRTVPVRANLHMLVGEGGNIGVLSGADGVIVIDDQFAPLAGRLLDAIHALSDRPLRFVINTHWHLDHTDGNAAFARAGAVLVAQDNARHRLEKGQFMSLMQRMIEPAPPAALPTISFTDAMHFYLNGQDVHVLHLPAAHTDGDAVIHFPGLNAFHMGDTYVAHMYPFPDAESGGNIDGIIATADRLLPLMDGQTRVIPGHGALSDKAEYAAFRAMTVAIRANVKALIDKGLTREQVIAAKPSAAYDAAYGGGFIKPDVFAGMLFDQLSAR